MIISHGRQYVFVHIPKTGGTSLALALEAKAMKDDILVGDTPKSKQRRSRLKALKPEGRLWKHSRLIDIYGVLSPAEMSDYFVFTLVRNPWDRLVSYYHWLQVQTFNNIAIDIAQANDFTSFLNHNHIVQSVRNSPYQSYVTDKSGQNCCDVFLQLEKIKLGVEQIEDRLEFRLPAIERVNSSARDRDYRKYYSSDDATLVAELCADDIGRHGYQFDP